MIGVRRNEKNEFIYQLLLTNKGREDTLAVYLFNAMKTSYATERKYQFYINKVDECRPIEIVYIEYALPRNR